MPLGMQPDIALVNQVLSAKNVETHNCASLRKDTAELEREIDKLVYNFYGLTEDEVAVIEGGNP